MDSIGSMERKKLEQLYDRSETTVVESDYASARDKPSMDLRMKRYSHAVP